MGDWFSSGISASDFSGRFAYYLKRPSCAEQPNTFVLQSRKRAKTETDAERLPAANHTRLLLPINLRKCPLEVFSYVNEFGGERAVSLTLLHAADPASCKPGLIENHLLATKAHLERLANRFVRPDISTCSCVCVGKPAETLLTHARQMAADLIILSSYRDCFPAQQKPQSDVVEQVLGTAPCDVSLLRVRTHFNCEEQWAAVEDIVAALNYVGLLKPSNRWTPVAF